MNDKCKKSGKETKQATKMNSNRQNGATASRVASSSQKKKAKVIYNVLPCEAALQNETLMEGVDRVVESNRPLRGMTKLKHFVEREQPINIGRFEGQIKEYEILTMSENDVVTGFSLFKKNKHDEWCVAWMVTMNSRRSIKRMTELFKTTLVAGKGFGAIDLKFDLYKPEWKNEEEIYDFFSRGSGNRVSMMAQDSIFVNVTDFSYNCKNKPIIDGVDTSNASNLDTVDTEKSEQ